ncbi:hypothetical protein BDY19DRAFT_1046281 [Irpex rosettiformis]|uniref:Uncharacterized protein n=1 Tax=Irpex rosettiformis TaxID=378272 RepID=A0ACB8UDA1_9APHY|nr:hypothetical protein BDY19DRAFT_1046281 [Irpex rosettiformis]
MTRDAHDWAVLYSSPSEHSSTVTSPERETTTVKETPVLAFPSLAGHLATNTPFDTTPNSYTSRLPRMASLAASIPPELFEDILFYVGDVNRLWSSDDPTSAKFLPPVPMKRDPTSLESAGVVA